MIKPSTSGLPAVLFALALGTSGAIDADSHGGAADIIMANALAEFGEPALAADFTHLPYANPDAPKGGSIVLSDFGSFDTLNTYVLKGEWPSSIGLTSDSLMSGSDDELVSAYGLIAESAEYPADKSWIIFTIRPEARYHDGESITAEDFVFALDTIKEHGRPFLKSFYEDIEAAEALDERRVRFTMKTTNNMKPLMLAAQMGPLPRHYWADKDITKTTLEPPLSSGAYRITNVDPGHSITYERVEDYWAADLPINRGLNNFDSIRYDYYRDRTVQFEAFKADEIDFWSESSAKNWATEYNLPAIDSGEMIKAELANETPRGLGGFFINTRLEKFQDINTRKALLYLYDFEAIQRTLLYGYFQRIKSYFPNSDFGASGAPTEAELAVLKPFKDDLDPAIFTEAFEPPVTDGSGRLRQNKRIALGLFKEAGWNLKDGKLLNDSGEQLSVEIMTAWPETQKLSLPYVETMKSVGINASVRLVDTSQWRVRIDDGDFDTWTGRLNFFPPPGPELRSYYGCESASIRGSANTVGICDPAIDGLIENIIGAKDLETLKVNTRALDRILLHGYYAVPLYYNDQTWIAYWNKFEHPHVKPKYGVGFPGSWWIKQ